MDNIKVNEKSYHDRLFADGKGRGIGKYYSITKEMDRDIEKLLVSECASKRVLEYGCGKGSSAFQLARINAEVTGIDISDVAIAKARERARAKGVSDHARFMVMDAERLEFPPNSFDVVCGSGILHHLNFKKALAEIHRVLTPSGRAIFTEPMGHNPVISFYRKMTPQKRTPDEHPLKMRDIDEAREIFPLVETRFYNAFTLLLVPFRGAPYFDGLLRGISAIDRFMFVALPVTRRLAWSAVLVFSKSTKRFA